MDTDIPTLPDDPFLWLEDVDGERALAWAREQNARSLELLRARPEFQPTYDATLAVLDSQQKIPAPVLVGDHVYNFWKDEQHERGLWRRTSLASYRTDQPAWETVLDVDALAAAEGTPWVFKGAQSLPPEHRLCLVSLSKGGGDAVEVREFDNLTCRFVPGGFALPEAKSSVSWRDANTLFVGTDFGPGSLTASGYPRIVKLWTRGTPLSAAPTLFEAESADVTAYGFSLHTPEQRYDLVVRMPGFYRQQTFLIQDGRLVALELPQDAEFHGIFKAHVLVALRSDWSVAGHDYRSGSLLATGLDALLRGGRDFAVLFLPQDRVSLAGVATTREQVLVETLDNVRSRLASLRLVDGHFERSEVALPGIGTADIAAASDQSDVYFLSYQDFLTPASLWLADRGAAPERVKSMPAFFDSAGISVIQHEAVSPDGTRVPYFLVTPAGFQADGTAPTLLYGYGGFEVAQVPRYLSVRGGAWLRRGGVYALANIRGGGEFGPAWHAAALKQNRIKSFQDFIAVAEDLIARRVTSPRHLGSMGGSQGGLLVGGAFTLRPELFGAVVAQVPLADMRRYAQLLAGASWLAEYGDPEVPEEWAYIQTWSPYHLLRADVRYPTPFYWTTTRDDRVHPGHARKMVARMQALGHPVHYFEDVEGGHGAGSVNKQTATITALEYAYLWMMLG